MEEVVLDAPKFAHMAKMLEKYGDENGKELRKMMTQAISGVANRSIVPALRASVTAGRTDTKVRASGGRKARAQQALSKSKAYQNATANESLLGSAKARRQREALERRALTGTTSFDVGDGKKRTMASSSLRASIAKGVRVETRASGKRAGVRVVSRSTYLSPDQKRLPRHMNRGRWRHPVFARGPVKSWTWVEQTFTPGWFDKPVRENRPAVREAIEAEAEEWLKLIAFLMEKAAKQ